MFVETSLCVSHKYPPGPPPLIEIRLASLPKYDEDKSSRPHTFRRQSYSLSDSIQTTALGFPSVDSGWVHTMGFTMQWIEIQEQFNSTHLLFHELFLQ